MLPLLYAKTATPSDFTSNNGLGFITTTTKCEVVEERNGLYECELEVSSFDDRIDDITPFAYVKVKANPIDDPQIFEIYLVDKGIKKTTIRAAHIRYRLSGNAFTETYYPDNSLTPAQVWTDIQDVLAYNMPFTFTSNITTTAKPTAAKECPVRLGEFLLGKDGSLLDTYSGEYHFNNFAVELKIARGTARNSVLRAGAGIASMEYEVNTESCYSALLPYCKLPYVLTTTNETIGEIFVDGGLISTTSGSETNVLPYDRVLSYDFTEDLLALYPKTVVQTDNGASPTQASWTEVLARLRSIANHYISVLKKTLTSPEIYISVEAQPGYETLNSYGLCDTIKVYYEPFDLTRTVEIVRLTYDSLAEKVVSIDLNTIKRDLARLFPDKNIGGG